MAAKVVGRPVKLAVTRAQMFTSNGYRPRTVQKLRFAADDQGHLVSMRHDGFSQTSQTALGEFVEPVGLATEMLYACPNVAVTHRAGRDAREPADVYARARPRQRQLRAGIGDRRACGGVEDGPAGVPPAQLRREDPHQNKPFASKALRECYRQGADAFGWSRRSPEPRSMRDGNMLIGWGMATSTYPTHRMPASARVRVGANGTALVQVGTQDLGTGTYTVMSQIAADTLGMPVERIQFELGDSGFPHAPVSGGSMTVASVGPAVKAACEAVRAKLQADAGASLPELLAARNMEFVEATSEAKSGEEEHRYAMHAFGAQFVEVRIDPDLGEIRVSRFVGAFDAGRS